MTERTTEQLNDIAQAITRAMYDTGEQYGLLLTELAEALILVASNVGFAAWNGAIVEQLRNAADVFEQQLIEAQP